MKIPSPQCGRGYREDQGMGPRHQGWGGAPEGGRGGGSIDQLLVQLHGGRGTPRGRSGWPSHN